MMHHMRLGIIAGLVILASTAFALVPKDTVSAALATAPYSTAELNAKLRGGVQQAIDWDKECHDNLRQNRRNGLPPRQAINEAPSYQGKQWLSLADTATQNNSSRTAPIIVQYGAQSVPLQLNIVKFLCAALVSPDGHGADFAYTNPRVVRNLNNANDRRPNPMGGNTNWPALTDTRFRIDNIQVVQGDGHIAGTAIGQYIGTARQNTTRYWFANPVKFDFRSNSPEGITSDMEIRIRFTLRGYNTYYYNTYQCYANGNTYTYPPRRLNIRICDQNNVTLSIRIQVNGRYELTPEASLGGRTTIGAGESANVQNTVTKGGDGSNSRPTDWRLTQLTYAPGKNLSTDERRARDGGADPCGSFTADQRSTCDTVQRNQAAVFNRTTTAFDPLYRSTVADSLPAGTRICYVASVSRPTHQSNPLWRHSAMVCMMVSKKPKIEVHGGDLWAGRKFTGDMRPATGRITTGATTINDRKYGSWAEYGMFATGRISGMASGAGLAGGRPIVDATDQNLNRLTFANTPSYGSFTSNPGTIPDYAGIYGGGSSQNSNGSLDIATANGSYKSNGNLTVQSTGQVAKGKRILIHANNITINNSIVNEDTYAGLNEIPRVIIVADGNIFISPDVERIDAWIITKETLYTCNQTGPLTVQMCNRQLVINGPVAAREVSLRRTHSGDTAADSDRPAEIFNLRPDMLLSAYQEVVDRGRAQTVYQIELPPRF